MGEEIVNIGEQPAQTEVHAVATDGVNGTEMSVGSPLGKFKDSAKLLDAYNELQGAFTRKCQKLSEVEKKLQEMGESNGASEVDLSTEEFAWNKNIKEFLQSHQNAKNLVEDITNEIINDESLRHVDDGLEKAYLRVVEKKYVPQEDLATNQDFLEKYIYSNDEIKNKIIKDYVSTLQSTKSPITISNDGFSRGVAAGTHISSLDDARKYVEQMFKF